MMQGRHEDELPNEQPGRKSLDRLGAPGKTEWLVSCLGGQVAEGGAGMGIQKWLEKDPRAFI